MNGFPPRDSYHFVQIDMTRVVLGLKAIERIRLAGATLSPLSVLLPG